MQLVLCYTEISTEGAVTRPECEASAGRYPVEVVSYLIVILVGRMQQKSGKNFIRSAPLLLRPYDT
jgi:hypothetical protein